MARRRAAEVAADPHDALVAEYRARLAEPAILPESAWEPVRIGPTWQIVDGHWLLPERTLGWDVLGWCGTWLQHEGKPWRFTLEQARFLLWWYALDEDGAFLYRDGVLQRLKGWGKDPIGACIAAVEALGPCRFGGWRQDGSPIAITAADAWVQTAAVAIKQTKNTMRLFPSLFTPAAKRRYRIQVGKEQVHALDGEAFIEALTSSPGTLEGARATFVLLNETHHWTASNEGLEMSATIERNATKSPDGAARTLRITNAYEPSVDSVARQDREAYEKALEGEIVDSGLLYDSLEAPPDAPLTAEDAPAVVAAIRGDSIWLNIDRIIKSILDIRNPPSRSRRFWYNQITGTEDAWCDPLQWDARARPDIVVKAGTQLALFFDGSKSDDATVLIGSRISDGHVITLGVWQKPPGKRGETWLAPRSEVDACVTEVFKRFKIVGFYADPSHTKDDETLERYWDGLIDDWHRRYGAVLKVKATAGKQAHSVMWDMTSPERTSLFTAAAERTLAEIERGELTHDGDLRLRSHVHNARRWPNRYGVSLGKVHRESAKKVDAAVGMVGARMVRRDYLNKNPKKARSGRVTGI